MRIIWILICFTLLLLNVELIVGAPKRTFGLGRNRPKSNSNSNIRRRGHSEQPRLKPDGVIKTSGGVMGTVKKTHT